MAFLAQKLVACIIMLAVVFTGIACGCAHDGGEDRESAVVSHRGLSGGGGHHQESGQDHHDDCDCAAAVVSNVADHPGMPNLRPAFAASWTFSSDVAYVLPLRLLVSSDSHTFLIALERHHRAGTSLLRQHCALTI